MVMESTRRSFDRSISKEPGLKKPRLAEDHAAPRRSSGDRSGFIQRSVLSNAGGGSRARRDGDSESGDSVRGPCQPQPGGQLQQELVNQYRVALSELTFNSKPIITNLTIIAGENLHSAKAIAATVCTNILEVPREQKLPSLYLLDSIVKNIGRDYIKCFATRLPEVFCKAYGQVDPSIHQGMRHLFGTWKGVFPPHILQMIEKELGFTATANGSSSGMTSSRPDSQAQRPPHSIHVNPKYLEARQRFQTTKARGSGNDTSGSLVSSHEDVEAPGRPISISSDRLSADPSAKHIHHHYKDKVSEAVRHKSSSAPYLDPEYGSNVSGSVGLGTGRVSPKFKEQGLDQSWHESGGSNATGKLFNKRDDCVLEHGFVGRAATLQPGSNNLYPLLKPNFASRATNGVSRSWENDEEEEYTWDGMNSRPNDRDAAATAAKDSLTSYVYEKLGLENQFKRSQGMLDTGPSVPDETSTDSLSGTQIRLSSSKELYPSEAMLLGVGHNIPGYTQGNYSELKNIANTVTRKPFQSQQSPAPMGGQTHKFSTDAVSGPKGSIKQPTFGTASTQSGLHQYPPSPSLSAHNRGKLLSNHAEENQTSSGLPKDLRRPPVKNNAGSHDLSSQGSQPLSSKDAYEPCMQKFKPQSLQALPATMHAVKQRKHFPSTQLGKLEESSDVDRLLKAEISVSGSQSVIVKTSSDQSNPHIIDSTGQPVSSNLLTATVKSGRLGSTSLTGGLSKSGIQGVGLGLPQLVAKPSFPSVSAPSPQPSLGNMMLPRFSCAKSGQAPLPPISPPSSLAATESKQATNAVKPSSDPVSSLLSSLVAKGLIAASKSDSSSAAATQKSDRPLGRLPGISSTRTAPASSDPVSTGKQLLLNTDELSTSEPSANASDDLFNSSGKIKNLIGFEFKSDIIRTLHSDVLSDLLSDLPYQCSICGLRLKLQEPFDRHMEWHALGISEPNSFNKKSRMWYANTIEWVTGVGNFPAADSISDLFTGSGVTLESCKHMVPADERHCACLCCGELFEEFYSQERNEWMFKEAMYLSIPSSEVYENSGSASSDPSCLSPPIVHVNCMSEDLVQDMGLASDVELKDA